MITEISNLESWRISSGVIVYFPKGKAAKDYNPNSPCKVAIVDPEAKSSKVKIKKLFSYYRIYKLDELLIENVDSFKLRLRENLKLEIRHEKFPNKEAWYEIINFLGGTETSLFNWYGYYLSYINTSKGEFEGNFEAIFSSEFLSAVSFTHPNLPIHDNFISEFERKINVGLYKKTSKWIPGHRYDTLDNTFYYVGEFKSRVSNRGTSKETIDLSDNPTVDTVYGFYNVSPSEEILWNKTRFSTKNNSKESIFLINKKKTAVCVSSFIDNPDKLKIEDPNEWRETIWKNTLENSCKKEIEVVPGITKTTYDRINLLIEPYLLVFESDKGKNLSEIFDPIKEQFKEIILNCFKELYQFPSVYKSKDSTKLVTEFISLYIKEIFVNKYKIITEFFKVAGLPLEELAKDFINSFNSAIEYTGTIESFLRSENYVTNTVNSTKFIDLRPDKTNLKDFVSSELSQELYDIISYAADNYGDGVEEFCSDKTTTLYASFTYVIVNIRDIYMKYYNRGLKIPSKLEQEILNSSFWSANIMFDDIKKLQ